MTLIFVPLSIAEMTGGIPAYAICIPFCAASVISCGPASAEISLMLAILSPFTISSTTSGLEAVGSTGFRAMWYLSLKYCQFLIATNNGVSWSDIRYPRLTCFSTLFGVVM